MNPSIIHIDMAKTKRKTLFIYLLILIFIVIGGSSYFLYTLLSTSFDINKTVHIYIDYNKNYESILTQLDTTAHIQNIEHFKKLSDFLKYPENIKTGRYKIEPNSDIRKLLKDLEAGHQSPIQLKFNNIRLKVDLAERLSQQLMLSKDEILGALNDSAICKKYGFTPNTFIAMFIPNTYEVYWDTSLSSFLDRMNIEYKKFWNDSRRQKAKEQGLSEIEVSTLASIVEEECFFADEYPIVAGLYLNRLRRGQLLQADPTVKYSVGDFSLQRILYKHLEVDSPYNTYIYQGLPPGPIRMSSIKAIDAVLNPTQHNYLFMCAKEDFSGRHRFAKTNAEHDLNAALYRDALNKRKIYK